jgi:hypothetical protein
MPRGRDPDAAGDEAVGDGGNDLVREVVARSAHAQALPHLHLLVHPHRSAPSLVFAQHRDPPGGAVGRVAAERVLPFDALGRGHARVGEDQIDVRSGLPDRQIAAVVRDEVQRHDPVGQHGAGGDHEVAFDVTEVAHGSHSLRSRSAPVREGGDRPHSSRGFNTAAIPTGLAGNTSSVY